MDRDCAKQLEEISKITNTIIKIYNLLAKYEIENNKNSKRYQLLLEILWMLIEKEKELYQYFDDDYEETKKIINRFQIEVDDSLEKAVVFLKEKECSQLRVINRLSDATFTEESYLEDSIDESYLDIIEGIDEGPDYLCDLFPVLQNEVSLRFADFIQQSIISEKNEQVKEKLIKIKYYIAFLNPKLEEYYINNHFGNLPKRFSEDIIVESYEIPDEVIDDIFATFGMTIAGHTINELEEFDDTIIDNENNKSSIIALQDLLKTALLFLKEDDKIELFDEVEKLFNSFSSLKTPVKKYKKVIQSIIDTINDSYNQFLYANKDLRKDKGEK